MNKIKISMIAIAMLFVAVGCKKKIEDVSSVVTASYPEIVINGSQFVSMPVGGTFVDAGSTAYDSLTKEYSLQPISVTNDIDPTTPVSILFNTRIKICMVIHLLVHDLCW